MTSLSSQLHFFRQVGSIIGWVGLSGCLLGLGLLCPQIIGGIVLGLLMASGESVVHSAVSPDNQITALVISDSCGATCGCTVRVDLKTDDQYFETVWRGIDVCDATVTWLNPTEFYVLDDRGQWTQLNVQMLGLPLK
jgi:hypothetical protein